MSIIIGAAKNNEPEKEKTTIEKVYDLVELFTISQRIMGENIEMKHTNPYDETHQIKVVRNERYDFLKARYSPTMVTVEFIAHRGVDDKLIDRLIEIAKEDESGDDRFLVENEKGTYTVTGIFIGYDAFEEMFPKMYSHS